MADRMTEADWQRVTLYAAPQNIEVRLKTAQRALRAAQRAVDRWEALRVLRAGQVEAGTWPESAVQAMTAEEEARRAAFRPSAPAGKGADVQQSGNACTPACWTPVDCPSCGNQLPPRGRSMPSEMGIMDCCDAARMDPTANPRHLWNEEEASA